MEFEITNLLRNKD